MAELLVFGTFWFWTLLVIVSIAIITMMECQKEILATFVAILSISLFIFCGNRYVLPWIIGNPEKVVFGIVGYIVVAVIWSIIKFWFYTNNIEEFIREKQKWWLRHRLDNGGCGDDVVLYKEALKTGQLTGACLSDWRNFVSDWNRLRWTEISHNSWFIRKPLDRPKTKEDIERFVDENKPKILSWMVFCPLSIIWTLLNDPVRKLMKVIFRYTRGVFVYIASKAFGVIAQG